MPLEIFSLVNLTRLVMDNNNIVGEISALIGNLINLEVLSLYANELSGYIPSQIGNLTNLHLLYLSDNQLSGVASNICNLNIDWSFHFNFLFKNN